MRAIQKIIYCAQEGTYAGKPARMLLSQSNPNNKDGSFWCGRTSASDVYNYYQLVDDKGDSALIHNQSDKAPYNLLLPDGSFAALSASGSCAPDELYKSICGGEEKWEYVALYPVSVRGDQFDAEKLFHPLLDHLDANNPAFFASGLSRGGLVASHFVVITGYRFKDGDLWFHITDPATSFHTLTDILGLSPKFASKASTWLEMIQPGAWATPGATYKSLGSMYWVRAEALLVPNPLLVGKSSNLPPIPLVCDNEYHPGFQVKIAKRGTTIITKENPKIVETVHANGFAIEPAAKSPNWKPWVDTTAPYPLGSAITWHGGVHVLASSTTDRKLYSMGPGEIVLVRFPNEIDPPTNPLSNGFVLVRHRLDVERRTLIAPLGKDEKEESGKEALYSLVMHTAALSELLTSIDDDGKTIQVRKPDAPRWLRRLIPEPVPALRKFIPNVAPKILSVHADKDASDKGEWSSFPAAPTGQYGRVGVELEVDESGGNLKLNGLATGKVTIGGAAHVALPDTAATQVQTTAKKLTSYEPKLSAEVQLHYYNPVTGALIPAGKIKAKSGQIVKHDGVTLALVHDRDGQTVVRDGKTYVEVPLYPSPGFVAGRDAKMHFAHSLLSFTKAAGLSMKSGASTQSLGPLDAPTRLLFSGTLSGGVATVDLLPVVKVSASTYQEWCENAKSKTGVAPVDAVTALYNPVTEEVIDVPALALPPANVQMFKNTKVPLRVAEIGGDILVGIDASVAFELTPDPAETAPDAAARAVMYLDGDVKSISMSLTTLYGTAGDPKTRYFGEDAVLELKNADVMLVFGVKEHAQTKGKERVWPDLVPCVGVADDQIQTWDQELKSSETGPLADLRERISSGRSRMMGVKFDAKSGWTYDADKGVITQGDPPKDTARKLCEVGVKDGAFVLVEVKSGTGPSPWEVGDIASIYPFEIQNNKAGEPILGVFELMLSTEWSNVGDNGADRSAARDENDKRAKWVNDVARKGQIWKPDEPIRVGREPVGAFAGDVAHLEIFAEKNVLDTATAGQDEKVVKIPKTPFYLLRDDDSSNDYSAEFIGKIVGELGGVGHFDSSSLDAALMGNGVIKGSEWADVALQNIEPLSWVVSAHESEWDRRSKDALDGEKLRGGAMTPEERQGVTDALQYFGFLDELGLESLLYHFHPFRFLEWITTGVDVETRGVDSPAIKIELDGKSDDLAPEKTRKTALHSRRVLGERAEAPATLVLGAGFKTATTRLPISIKRGGVTSLVIVNPSVTITPDIHYETNLDTAVPVTIGFAGAKDLILLPDGCPDVFGKSGLAIVRFGIDLSFNLAPPTSVKVKLEGAGFRILRRPIGSSDFTGEVSSDGQSITITPKQPTPKLFSGSQSLSFVVDVGPGTDPDKTAKLVVDVDGGDFQALHASGPPVRTRGEIKARADKSSSTTGEDVAKLEVYLSQIPAADGRPCYRSGGYVKGKSGWVEGAEFSFKPKTKTYIDGVYKTPLAKALWRFLYRYCSESGFSVKSVDITRDPPPPLKKGAAPAAPAAVPPTSISLDDLRRGVDVAKRVGDACVEFPVVKIELIREVVKHFRAPWVLPHVHVAVVKDRLLMTEAGARGVKLADNWGATDETRSAILPIASDSIELELTAPAVQSADGKLSVELTLPGGSAYSFADGTAKLTLDLVFGAGKVLPHIKLKSTKKVAAGEAENLLTITAQSGETKVNLGTLQLYGARDLSTIARDGKARRDAAWVTMLLASQVDANNQFYYHPVSKNGDAALLDGCWNEARKAALSAVKKAHSSPPPGDLIEQMKASIGPATVLSKPK